MADFWDVAGFVVDLFDVLDVLDVLDLLDFSDRGTEEPQLTITRRPWWPPDTSASSSATRT
jgi:hypothetical protein